MRTPKNPHPIPELLPFHTITPKQTSVLLGLAPAGLRRMERDGWLHPVPGPRGTRYELGEVLARMGVDSSELLYDRDAATRVSAPVEARLDALEAAVASLAEELRRCREILRTLTAACRSQTDRD